MYQRSKIADSAADCSIVIIIKGRTIRASGVRAGMPPLLELSSQTILVGDIPHLFGKITIIWTSFGGRAAPRCGGRRAKSHEHDTLNWVGVMQKINRIGQQISEWSKPA